VDTSVTGSFTSALCHVWSGIRISLFLVKCTRQQCMYLYNEIIEGQFQQSWPKCRLIQAIPKHVVISL